MKSVPRIAPIAAIVVAAFFGSGRLNTETPLEMTSTPVSAVHPEENARKSKKRVVPSVAFKAALCAVAAGPDGRRSFALHRPLT